MNKQELIGKYEYLNHNYFRRVDTSEVLKDLKQLDEPQKVTIPQFVVEHIKHAKEIGRDLQDAMNSSSIHKEVDEWLYTDNNMELFARAWLDGYVEEEKRYTVKFKGVSKLYECLNFDTTENRWKFFDCDNTKTYRTHHTRKQLEEAGFGWVFDCEGTEVEEVEDDTKI